MISRGLSHSQMGWFADWRLFLLISGLKVLLWPAYRSTDFDIHRNWLAITHNLPLSEWYTEDTAKDWTLDYPPFFAWGQWLTSLPAVFFADSNNELLDVVPHSLRDVSVTYYMRSTVIISDAFLYWVLLKWASWLSSPAAPKALKSSKAPLAHSWLQSTLIILVFAHPSLFFLDHIHFQYNGALLGVLLLSMLSMMSGSYLWGAFQFAFLLNAKHIYLSLVPAVTLWLARVHVWASEEEGNPSLFALSIPALLQLGGIVISVFSVSLGPFAVAGQLPALLERLFPVARGLTHSYWAGNLWAFYNTIDRVLIYIAKKSGIATVATDGAEAVLSSPGGGLTVGLVGDGAHLVLPIVTPGIAGVVTVLLQLLPLYWLIWKPRRAELAQTLPLAVAWSAMAYFLAGWHVHEKAILTVLFPLTPLALSFGQAASSWIVLSSAATFSLFPLLFYPAESSFRLAFSLAHLAASYVALSVLHGDQAVPTLKRVTRRQKEGRAQWSLLPMGWIDVAVIVGTYTFVLGFTNVVHPLLWGMSMEFLPLLVTSVWTAVVYVYWTMVHLPWMTGDLSGGPVLTIATMALISIGSVLIVFAAMFDSKSFLI